MPISGAKNTTYVLASADVGHRLIMQVKAANQYGAAFVQLRADRHCLQHAVAGEHHAADDIAGSAVVGATLTLTSAGILVDSDAARGRDPATGCAATPPATAAA